MSKKRAAAHNRKTGDRVQVKLEASVRKVPERQVDENALKTARSARESGQRMQYRVTKVDDGQRLDRWCKVHLAHIPYGSVQKLLRKGAIRVDDAKAKADQRLKAGQVISAPKQEPGEQGAAGRKKPEVKALTEQNIKEVRSWVLYQDEELIVIDKPYGLAVQGGSGVVRHLDMLMPALQFKMDAPPKLVHRLDRDTSGVLVLARTREAAADLQKGFANKRIRKVYVALCMGVPERHRGEIISRMEKAERGKDTREVVVSGKDGKAAVTRYRVLESLAGKMCMIELEPVTGRTHQLRVHMAELGCPIVGDGKYGGKAAFAVAQLGVSKQLHLHAWHIELPRPDGKVITVKAKLPEHMRQSCKALNLKPL